MKNWICGLCVLCVLALAGCGVTEAKDSAHPYRYVEKKDGSVTLKITGELPEGYRWYPEGDAPVLTAATEEQNSENAWVLVAPAEGTYVARFVGRSEESPMEEQTFAVEMTLEADSGQKLQVKDSKWREYDPVATGDQDARIPYSWAYDQNNALRVYVEDSKYMWTGKTEGKAVSVAVPEYDEKGCLFTITAAAAGKQTVRLVSEDAQLAIRIELEVDDSGWITVTEHAQEKYGTAQGQTPDASGAQTSAGGSAHD